MVDTRTATLLLTWKPTPSVYKSSKVREQDLEPGDLQLVQEKPSQWPDPRMLLQILEQRGM